MNMMTMSKLEEAIDETFKKSGKSMKYGWANASMKRCFKDGFDDGFRAGVAWVQSQAKIEGSSQALGNISPQFVRTLISQFIVWAQLRHLWPCRLSIGEQPQPLAGEDVAPLWKEFAAELCGGVVVSQYPAAVEEPEEEIKDEHRCLVEPDQPWPRRES